MAPRHGVWWYAHHQQRREWAKDCWYKIETRCRNRVSTTTSLVWWGRLFNAHCWKMLLHIRKNRLEMSTSCWVDAEQHYIKSHQAATRRYSTETIWMFGKKQAKCRLIATLLCTQRLFSKQKDLTESGVNYHIRAFYEQQEHEFAVLDPQVIFNTPLATMLTSAFRSKRH